MNTPRKRPVFFDLTRLHLPLPGLVSIAHRIGGVLLFLALPLLPWLLERSLRGPAGFARVEALLAGWPLRLALVVIVWALVHHLFAGLRLLLMDVEIGVGRDPARRSARWVGAVGLAALAAALVWAL